MKKFPLLFLITFLSSTFSFAQAPAKWSVNGNSTASGDFLGTTNNNPLIFYANNTEWMRLKTNGDLKINSLSGTGNNFIFSNSSGVLFTKTCSADTNKFMTEAGVFRTASSFTGWKFNGNNIHTINGSYVGIGTNNPQYQLDVSGDARFNGTLYSLGLVLATKMQADTVKSTSMISVNNNLSFYSGLVNDIYTSTGDVRLQSRIGYGGNTILNAGNNGNVGIGIYTPQYKFDVNGSMRVSGSVRLSDLAPSSGFARLYIDSAGNLRTSLPQTGNCTSPSVYDWNLHGNSGTDPVTDFIGTCDNQPVIFATNGLEKMRISHDGTVIFGTPTSEKMRIRTDGRVIIGLETMSIGSPHDIPSTLLTVNGTAVCRELYVTQSNWADSVLRSDYNLISLDSVANFVDSLGHLPGVPGELEVKTNGNNIGQTDVILLAKVEELTLYMIKLQRENDAMKGEIEELKRKK